jgi:DNA adenine methylase
MPVASALPVAPYLGGKRNLAKRLISLIDATPHNLYAEPFVGMGGVFLRRKLRPKAEVINDFGKEVFNFYRVLQVHYVAFLEMLRFQITMRAEFERLTKVDPETLTDMQRAARFLYLQRVAFGGKPTGQSYGVSVGRPGRFDVTRLQPMLEDLHERLAGVDIECLPFDAFMRRYDRPGTLFYIDPPYWGGEDDYGKGMFPRSNFEVLRDLLEGLQGRFILSINDVPATRELFGQFEIVEAAHTYRISGAPTEAKELIVMGGGRLAT